MSKKCKECTCCKKGWFSSRPYDYVCIGVPEPFIIRDINVECTEYKDDAGLTEYRGRDNLTNADHIRSMTDEELAEFILNCVNREINICHIGECLEEETCIDCTLRWLHKHIDK